MQTWVKFTAAAVVAVTSMTVLNAQIAKAQAEPPRERPICAGCHQDVNPEPGGISGSVESEVEFLNDTVSNPQPCDGTIYHRDGTSENNVSEDPIRSFPGQVEYRISETDRVSPDGEQLGTYYYVECVDPVAGDRSDPIDFVLFENITPENLAQLAMDRFFLGLDAPKPRFNPAGPTLVNFETWMWVDNIAQDQIASEPISVPGLTVQAFAEPNGVDWDMGDGNVVHCDDTGAAYDSSRPDEAQSSDCTHDYVRSSAGEENDVYHGSANLLWIGTYTVNGVLADEQFDIERETPFTLGVQEAQALNTGSED